MSQAEDLSLLTQIRETNDQNAREELVRKYLPMVRYIVKNHYSNRIDFDDCFQEGAISLLKAISEYDSVNYPIKFSTFAYICILRRIYNLLKQAYSKKAVFFSQTLSINASFGENDQRTLLNSIPGRIDESFEEIENDALMERLNLVLEAYLSPIEYQVMQMFLTGYRLSEIEEKLQLSFKAIDNARTRARAKLKKVIHQYGSLTNPQIPMKPRRRKDLNLKLEVS